MAHKYIELDVDALREKKVEVGDYATCSWCDTDDIKIVYMYGETEPLCATCAKEILN